MASKLSACGQDPGLQTGGAAAALVALQNTASTYNGSSSSELAAVDCSNASLSSEYSSSLDMLRHQRLDQSQLSNGVHRYSHTVGM